jgi:hypothetical protein
VGLLRLSHALSMRASSEKSPAPKIKAINEAKRKLKGSAM